VAQFETSTARPSKPAGPASNLPALDIIFHPVYPRRRLEKQEPKFRILYNHVSRFAVLLTSNGHRLLDYVYEPTWLSMAMKTRAILSTSSRGPHCMVIPVLAPRVFENQMPRLLGRRYRLIVTTIYDYGPVHRSFLYLLRDRANYSLTWVEPCKSCEQQKLWGSGKCVSKLTWLCDFP
jgi:hypothetical protein